jgi:DNA-binding transcriptional ArsR family regulator
MSKLSAVSSQQCFRALADPTRRAMFGLLVGGELSVTELASRFTITQPALSQHLAVLRAARLVRERRQGRFHYYCAVPSGLKPAIDWMAQYDSFWRRRLSHLNKLLDRMD